MNGLLLAVATGAIALTAASIALVAVLSLRALRRGAELKAEMKAATFAFRLHLQPHGEQNEPGNRSAKASAPSSSSTR